MKHSPANHLALVLSAGAMCCAPLGADASIVTEWNDQMLEVARLESVESPFVARNLAMMQNAVYNAVQGITGVYEIYANGSYAGPSGTPISGASAEAAAAAAAFTVLSDLYPAYVGDFAALYSSQLSGIAENPSKYDGINYGTLVANDILNWRATDGAATAGSTPYTPVGTAGHWAATPPTFGSAELPGWGSVTPFAVASSAGFTTTLTGTTVGDYVQTAQYAADYNQVIDLGSASSQTRTPDHTNMAYFWAGSTGTITPVGLWNEAAKVVINDTSMSLDDEVRTLAALNTALADVSIIAWEMAYNTDFWRPVTGIVFGDFDSNAATAGDPAWVSLIDSPLYPEYVSAQAAYGNAAAQVLAAVAGGDIFSFGFDSDIDGDGITDLTRTFTSFSQAAGEAGLAGIYGGTHFATSVTDGATSGGLIGAYVMDNNFAPVPEPSGALLVMAAMLSAFTRRRNRR